MLSKKKIIGIVAIILVAILMVGVFFVFGRPKSVNKSDEAPVTDADSILFLEKSIVIKVIGKDSQQTEYEISTHAEYLSQAMDEAQGLTYSGTDGAYGLMLEEINGQRAIYEEDGAYWSILVDGEYGMHGVDTQPVEDGVEYSIVYTLA